MAEILLNVRLKEDKLKGDLDSLKKSLQTVVDSMNAVKPNKDLTEQIKALATYYKNVADAATKANKAQADKANADAKEAQATAKVTEANAKAAAAIEKARAEREKANKAATDAATAEEKHRTAIEKANKATTDAAAAEERRQAAAEKRAAAQEKAAKQDEEEAQKLWNLEKQYASLVNQINAAADKYPSAANGLGSIATEANRAWEELQAFNRGEAELTTGADELRETYQRLSAQMATLTTENKDASEGFKALQRDQEALEAATEKAANEADALKVSLNNMLTAISNIEGRYPEKTFDELKDSIKGTLNEVNNLSKEDEHYIEKVEAAKKSTDGYKVSLAEIKAQTEHLTPAVATLGDKFSDMVTRFAKFEAASLLIRAPLNAIKSALSDVGDILVNTEDKVIELQRVLSETIPSEEISSRLYDIAYQYGSTFDDAALIAGNFARAGRTWTESIEATEAALLAMNVAELNATQASDGLLSIIQQFGMETSDLTMIVDKLNKTADKNPVSTEKLLKAIQRAGSAAKNANISFDETLALITSISEATNRSGENIGTALNSLIQYSAKNVDVFASLSDEAAEVVDRFKSGLASITDVWKQVALDIHNDKESRDNIISALGTDDLEELSSTLHDELGDLVTQIDDTYNVANTYRKNYFIALLDNMVDVQDETTGEYDILSRFTKVLNDLQDVQNYSNEENQKYLETYNAKLNQLHDKWQAIANDEQGILGVKKSLVEIGIGVLDIIDNFGGLLKVTVDIGNAIGMIYGLTSANKIAGKVVELTDKVFNLQRTTEEAAVATASLSTAFSYLTIGVGIVVGVTNAILAYNRAQQEARDKAVETMRAHKEQSDELAELNEKLKMLSTDSDEYAETEEKIVALLGDKTDILKNVEKGTDDYRAAIEKLTEAQLAQYRMEALAAKQAAEDTLTKGDYGFGDSFSSKGKFYRDAAKDAGINMLQYDLGLTDNTAESILNYYDKLIAKQDELALSYEKLIAAGKNNEAAAVYKEWEENGKIIDSVRDSVETYRSTVEEADETLQALAVSTQTELKKTADDVDGFAGKTRAELEAIAESFGITYDELIRYKDKQNELSGQTTDNLIEEAKATESATEGLNRYALALDKRIKFTQQYTQELEIVRAAQEEYAKYGNLSAETVEKLLGLDEKWRNALIDESGQLNVNSEAVAKLEQHRQNYIDATGLLIEKTEEEEEETKELTDRMAELTSEIDGVQSALSVLNDVQAEYSETGSISIDTLQKLIELGDEYIDCIIDEEGQLRLNTDAVDALTASKEELLQTLIAQQVEEYALNTLHEYMAQSTEEVGDAAVDAAEEINIMRAELLRLQGDEKDAQIATDNFRASLMALADSMGAGNSDWLDEWADKVEAYQQKLASLLDATDMSTGWSGKSSGSGKGTAGSASSALTRSTDAYLEQLKEAVKLRESELTLMQHQGAESDAQIEKIRQIQEGIHAEAEYLRSIGESQATINGLSSEWWSWQEKILAIQKQIEDEAEKAIQQEQNERIQAFKDQVELLKSELTLLEKQGAPAEEQVAKVREINAKLGEEIQYMRSIQADQVTINGLLSQQYDLQANIVSLQLNALNAARDAELKTVQDQLDVLLAAFDNEEDALEVAYQKLQVAQQQVGAANDLYSVTQSQAELEEKMLQDKISYVNDIISSYLTAESSASSLEDKIQAVADAREKLVEVRRKAIADSMSAAYKEQKQEEKSALDLEEKRLAVEKARQALAAAEKDLTTKVYNESTDQWEWANNKEKVSAAEQTLQNAVDSLNTFVEEQAWNEIIAAVEDGTITDAKIQEILKKWASESYGEGSPEFMQKIQKAYSEALGTVDQSDSVVGQTKQVENAVQALNDYLKQEAVKELKEYIGKGNFDREGMSKILDKWMGYGEGAELYEWRGGLLETVDKSIAEYRYVDDNVVNSVAETTNAVRDTTSAVNAVETAVNNLASALVSTISKMANSGASADEIREIIDKYAGALPSEYAEWGYKVADDVENRARINSSYDEKEKDLKHEQEVINQMKKNSADWFNADSEERTRLSNENLRLGTSMGWSRGSDGAWYYPDGTRVYDKGGVLDGLGGIKATSKPEIVLDPELTAKILQPRSDEHFRAFADALHLIFERGDRIADELPAIRGNSSVDSHNTSTVINGVPIPAQMAERYTIAQLCAVMPLTRR